MAKKGCNVSSLEYLGSHEDGYGSWVSRRKEVTRCRSLGVVIK